MWSDIAFAFRYWRIERLKRRARGQKKPRLGLAVLGLVASVPLGLAAIAALAIRDASEHLAARTADLALQAAATGEPVQAIAPSLWEGDDNGRLLWVRALPREASAPDVVRVVAATEIALPLLATLPVLSHWTVESTASSRRIAQSSLNARGIPARQPDPAVLESAYAAAFGLQLDLKPETYGRLPGIDIPLQGWLEGLSRLTDAPFRTYGDVADLSFPIAMLFRAAAEAVDDGASRNTLIALADRLADHTGTLSPGQLVDLGGNAHRLVGEQLAAPTDFDADQLLDAVARSLSAARTLTIPLPRKGTAFSAASAELTIDPDPMPMLAGTRRPPLDLRLPAGRIVVRVELLGATNPVVGRIQIPLAVSVGSGRVEAAEPVCQLGTGGSVPQQVRVTPGPIDARFTSAPGAGPPVIYEDARATAWLFGEGVVRPQAPAYLAMGGQGNNPTLRLVREPRDLAVVLREILLRADVRILVGDSSADSEAAAEESRLRLALADLVDDAAAPLEVYVRSIATAFGLPVEGVVVEAGATSCNAAELIE